MEYGWYYKFYLWLSDILSTLKVNGDLVSYKDTNIYGYDSMLHIFLPITVMIYVLCMLLITLNDYFDKDDSVLGKGSYKFISNLSYYKYVLSGLLVSYVINFATMLFVFWISFLFNMFGISVLFFFAIIIFQLILRYNDGLNNESTFNIIPSISSYINNILSYDNKKGEYKYNYNRIKNKRIWKT